MSDVINDLRRFAEQFLCAYKGERNDSTKRAHITGVFAVTCKHYMDIGDIVDFKIVCDESNNQDGMHPFHITLLVEKLADYAMTEIKCKVSKRTVYVKQKRGYVPTQTNPYDAFDRAMKGV